MSGAVCDCIERLIKPKLGAVCDYVVRLNAFYIIRSD